jgi:hypothetical protein
MMMASPAACHSGNCWADFGSFMILNNWMAWPMQAGYAGILISSLEGKVVSIIQNLAILGLAASLSVPSQQRQVDLKPDSAVTQRINQLWLVTFIDKASQETVAQARTTTGEYVPLIAADAARLETILEAAHGLATANNMTMRLVKFSNRLEMEEIKP